MSGSFEGTTYRTASNWFPIVSPKEFSERGINYLEIGAFFGANVISVAKSYCAHEDSKLYCVDPWMDYDGYSERKKYESVTQEATYETFLRNVENAGIRDKVVVNRGFSNQEVPKFEDNFFDIIYIDGNHAPEYVLEDAVLSFRKLKVGGLMIFDDYGWGGPRHTKTGIEGFLMGYHRNIKLLKLNHNTQTFIVKTSDHKTG